MKKLKKVIILSLLFISFTSLLFSEDSSSSSATVTPEPYSKNEFPQFMKDARRAEIISLGSMPFVTLNTTLGYSFIRYIQNDFSSDYIPNPFAKTTDSNGFTEDDQKIILLTSFGISVGIGITDLIVNLIKRSASERKAKAVDTGPIKIQPIDEDKDAFKIVPPPDKDTPPQDAHSDSEGDVSQENKSLSGE